MVCDSKYNPKLSNTSKMCNDYCRKEDETCERVEFKDEQYWMGDLTRRKTDYNPAKCTYKHAG